MRTAILLAVETLLWACALPATAAAPASGLPFIADDYQSARAEASRRHVPLFVEVWAPW